MALSADDTTAALGDATEIDLAELVPALPTGTTIEVAVHGDRSSYEIEIDRNDDRWLVEGSRAAAELTGVYGPGDRDKPERVPDWLARVLEDFGVREVSVRR